MGLGNAFIVSVLVLKAKRKSFTTDKKLIKSRVAWPFKIILYAISYAQAMLQV